MKLLIIGSGGREHSIGLKCQESQHNPTLFFAPGNAGTAQIGENLAIKDNDIPALIKAAKEKKIDITIVGPEQPLVDGIVDAFEAENLNIVGPSKAAAQIEGSKDWAKSLMKKYGIPTATFETFSTFEDSLDYIKDKNTYPIVIKADGLAAGKGVTIAHSLNDAKKALEECFISEKFGQAGALVVIEDFLQGEEASIFAFSDGKTMRPMLAAQDHKAIFDGDKGPNTGGMGAYCPAPIVTPELHERIETEVFTPMLNAFQSEGIPYKGILYAGLMIDDDGTPSIVEFNARFGDPETQVVLPLLKTDLIDIFQAICDESLDKVDLEWKTESAVDVVLASEGYPGSYEKGKVITGVEEAEDINCVHVVHAGTKTDKGSLQTNGGRVLAVVAKSNSLSRAIDNAYKGIDAIEFDGKTFRKDIGQKAFRHL